MQRSSKPFAEGLARLERWLLPAECLLCRERSAADHLVCPVCQSRWRPLPHPHCERCGQPLDASRACVICPAWPAGLVHAASAVWLDDSARKAVHALKYDGWRRVADSMAPAMAKLPVLNGRGVLVPIPLGASRLKQRGYNQSEQLARAVAARTGWPLVVDALVRRRETRSQTTLTPDQRAANLKDAFGTSRKVPGLVVLVDDVFTTGATLAAAAAALLAGGVDSVKAVTFARAELPLASVARAV